MAARRTADPAAAFLTAVTPRIALATAEHLPELDADSRLLRAPLTAKGLDAQPVVWSDPDVDWAAFDAVVIRSTWDYFVREDEFLAWIDRIEPLVPLVNPAQTLRWNAHKTYLRDLEEQGVPVVPTLYVDEGQRLAVPFDRAVVKPAVSGAAKGLRQAARDDEIEAEQDLLVQPLIDSITTEGELSLLYAGGELSHMVRKVPKRGDIRVQPEFGSDVRAEPPTDEHIEAAENVLKSVADDLAYARVDLVRGDDGTLRLIELELIEPQLYLAWDDASPHRFASALADAVSAPAAARPG